jgi:hypothetical protein
MAARGRCVPMMHRILRRTPGYPQRCGPQTEEPVLSMDQEQPQRSIH